MGWGSGGGEGFIANWWRVEFEMCVEAEYLSTAYLQARRSLLVTLC